MQKTLAWSTVIPLCSEGRRGRKKIIKKRERERGRKGVSFAEIAAAGEGSWGRRERRALNYSLRATHGKKNAKKIGVKSPSGTEKGGRGGWGCGGCDELLLGSACGGGWKDGWKDGVSERAAGRGPGGRSPLLLGRFGVLHPMGSSPLPPSPPMTRSLLAPPAPRSPRSLFPVAFSRGAARQPGRAGSGPGLVAAPGLSSHQREPDGCRRAGLGVPGCPRCPGCGNHPGANAAPPVGVCWSPRARRLF